MDTMDPATTRLAMGDKSSTECNHDEKPTKKHICQKISISLLLALLSLSVIGLIISNCILFLKYSDLNHDLGRAEDQLVTLSELVEREERLEEEVSILRRSKRSHGNSNRNQGPTTAPTEESQDDPEVTTPVSSCNNKCRSKNKSYGAHFSAHVDREKLARQEANGLQTVGEFTPNGFRPSDQTYKIWTPANWTNDNIFRYNENDGKVTVKRSGYYLIYGQMMFHGPSARKSYGIHVNDETMPLVESISFETLTSDRKKRSLPAMMAPGFQDNENYRSVLDRNLRAADIETEDSSQRNKRSVDRYATYNQCNTIAVTYLNRNDKVFLRSLERGRTIIPERSLTFWGLAKL